jgi:biopolymer transport protein ExbB/TolQ
MSILELWIENDWVIKILIIATFVVLVIAFEKMYQFFKVTKALNELKNIQSIDEHESLSKNNVSEILQDIESFKNSDTALFNANVGIKLDMFESSQMKYVGIISTIAVLAPMLGLIGTFIGVWHVFEGVGSVGLNDPAIIARGIKEVLIDTMAGLVVAVIAMIFFKLFEYLGQRNILMFEDKLYKLLKS